MQCCGTETTLIDSNTRIMRNSELIGAGARREREEGASENSRRTPASSSLPSTAASPGNDRAISRSRVARRRRGRGGRVGGGGGGRGVAESSRLRLSRRRRLREAAAVGGRAGNGGGFGAGAARSKGREVGREEEGGDPTKRLIRSFFLLARAYAPRAVRSNFKFHHGPSGLLQHNTTVCNNFFHATFPHI
jgi:hypothetical protein